MMRARGDPQLEHSASEALQSSSPSSSSAPWERGLQRVTSENTELRAVFKASTECDFRSEPMRSGGKEARRDATGGDALPEHSA